MAFAPVPAWADQDTRDILFFSGVDIATLSQFTWTGMDAPLFVSRNESGPVLRLSGGTGRYHYDNEYAINGRVEGQVTAGEALLGWRIIRPGLAATLLVGAGIEEHLLDQTDNNNDVQGKEAGLRVATEIYWEPTVSTRIDASAAYGSAFDLYRARLAGGYRVTRRIVMGAEAEASSNIGSDQQRFGMFIDGFDLGRLSLKASAGAVRGKGKSGIYGRIGADLYW